jgi:hypothetical protein
MRTATSLNPKGVMKNCRFAAVIFADEDRQFAVKARRDIGARPKPL